MPYHWHWFCCCVLDTGVARCRRATIIDGNGISSTVNLMHRCLVALAVVAGFASAVSYSSPGLCCDADSFGTKHAPGALAGAAPTEHTSPAAPAAHPQPAAAAQAASTSQPLMHEPASGLATEEVIGSGSPSLNNGEGAGGGPSDGAGATPVGHKRGLHWQSFLPGVIK
jgi:hypothetical protein